MGFSHSKYGQRRDGLHGLQTAPPARRCALGAALPEWVRIGRRRCRRGEAALQGQPREWILIHEQGIGFLKASSSGLSRDSKD